MYLQGGWELTQGIYDYAAHHPAAQVLSWEAPRLMLFKSFLSPDEVEHFRGKAENKLSRSEVLSGSAANAVDNARTSFGAWPQNDDVLTRVHQRIHRLVAIPDRFGEDFYILNYKHGQKYSA